MRATTLGLATLLFLVPCVAEASGAEANLFQLRDYYATARFHSNRPDPNNPGQTILTQVYVVVDYRQTQVPASGGWAPADESISLGVQDSGINVVIAKSTAPGEAPPLRFDIDPSLGSARLAGTITALDYITQQPVTVAVDLTWNPVGPIVRDESGNHTNDSTPDERFVITVRGVSDYRPAVATGIVSINSVNYTPLPSNPPNSDYGKIASYRAGDCSITVTRTP